MQTFRSCAPPAAQNCHVCVTTTAEVEVEAVMVMLLLAATATATTTTTTPCIVCCAASHASRSGTALRCVPSVTSSPSTNDDDDDGDGDAWIVVFVRVSLGAIVHAWCISRACVHPCVRVRDVCCCLCARRRCGSLRGCDPIRCQGSEELTCFPANQTKRDCARTLRAKAGIRMLLTTWQSKRV